LKILVLHSPYLSGPASGENRVVEDETRLLREGGHDVTQFRPARRGTPLFGPAVEGARAVWSPNAVREVRKLVPRGEVDVVHCHNLFPALSPAVLRAAADAGAAVLMTLHNFRLPCLPATLLRRGQVCELCVGRIPWRGVVHRCYRGSVAASATLATSLTLHRAIGSFERIDLYLAVSDFVRAKHLEAGLPAERIAVKPNFAWRTSRREGPGEHFLFAGRLSREKGVRTLITAWAGLRAKLIVAGDGPDEEALRREAPSSVEFLGQVDPLEMPALLERARALILPSIWYEGSPRIVLEAYAKGVPVVASAIGSLPDLVDDGVTGMLVRPGDSASLAHTVEQLLDDAESTRLGDGAWEIWSQRYTPERSLQELEAAYETAVEARHRRLVNR
jgi:glycosyltransferase involved in cell wall biosynthesis